MRRVLVTGASGSIGSRVARVLVHRGEQVVAMTRNGTASGRLNSLEGQITVIQEDFIAGQDLATVLRAVRPDVVIHAAWQGVKGGSRDARAQLDNLRGSLNLYQAAVASGCRTFIGIGSQAEYGIATGRLAETAPTNPKTLYGATKLATSILLGRLAEMDDVALAWIRLFSTYAAGDDPEWLLQHVARKLLAGERPALTHGEQVWDFLHADDAARAIVEAASLRIRGVFNVGSGEAQVLRNVLYQLRDIVDPSMHLGLGEIPYAADQIFHLEADVSKFKAATGWTPQIGLREGLASVVDWLRISGRE